jgi:hypothetical protein
MAMMALGVMEDEARDRSADAADDEDEDDDDDDDEE